jgi:hypothetical protein
MCNTDHDSPDFYTETSNKAIRDHNCSECRRVILKGERYKRVTGKWNGVVDTFKTCAHCIVIQDWLLKQCGGYLHGGLKEEIYEHAMNYQKIFIYRYLIGIQRKWRRFKDKKLMSLPKKNGAIE